MKKSKKMIGIGASIVIVVCLVLVCLVNKPDRAYAIPALHTGKLETSYQTYLDEAGYDGTLSKEEIILDITNFKVENGMEAKVGAEGVLTEDVGSITWNFQVPQSGFYNLELGYIALPGTTSDIQRKVSIDGESPYEALEQIMLKRFWRDDVIKEKNSNEIRPNSSEVYENIKIFLEDYSKRSGESLVFYLERGKHELTFDAIKEPLEITSLVFKASEPLPSYDQVIEAWQETYADYDDQTIICQAERTGDITKDIIKSSSSINIQKNYSDSNIEPYHPWHIIYNTIGADSWKQPGDSITWEVIAPKEGLYTLAFKGRQALNRGVTSYRRLYINGVVPFTEMNAIGFDYSSNMQNYIVANEEGEAYYFYLKEGSNTITLETVLGNLGMVRNEVEESLVRLNQMYLQVIQLTGQVPVKYIDYEIKKKIPEFTLVMEEESKRLFEAVDYLIELTGEKGENTSLLEKMAIEAQELANNPESVVEELTQLKNNISALGTWLVTISEMPLELDSILLSSSNMDLPRPTEGALKGMMNSIVRFFSTFFVKSNEFASTDMQDNTKEIKVWMASAGKEQAQIVQNMIDETFTPESGIAVNLQLIPVDVVLRAALAGNGPDVVIGLAQGTAQDFAMRNALVNLKELEGFKEVTEKYYDSTLMSSAYQDGIYGIPEQANFMMMFYRTDILDEIGLEVPDTWDEIKEAIPVIQKNNYDFYLPSTQAAPALYQSMVFQNGGNVYKGEGENYGIASGLDEEAAMIAFKDYTDLFTSHGLLVTADFSNRFRTGEMPIGITNYMTYCQLEIFAPEIKGLWGFAPLPGVKEANGEIDRSYIVDTIQSVIMSGREHTDASWKFVKWWNSTEAQLTYANTLESVMGTAARYPAADPNVLERLPWSNKELTQILTQFENTVGIQAVPGYYMNTRMIQYAFNEVVTNLANPRETLYLNIKAINKELIKKRESFGLSTAR